MIQANRNMIAFRALSRCVFYKVQEPIDKQNNQILSLRYLLLRKFMNCFITSQLLSFWSRSINYMYKKGSQHFLHLYDQTQPHFHNHSNTVNCLCPNWLYQSVYSNHFLRFIIIMVISCSKLIFGVICNHFQSS